VSRRRLLIVVNVDWFFVSHRFPIALAAVRQGYDVHLATEITARPDALRRSGLTVHPLSCMRGRPSFAASIRTFIEILRLCRRLKPDIVHLVTIRPVLLGGVAARLADVQGIVAAISGLGFVFSDTGLRARIRRFLVAGLYSLALKHRNIRIIFQNAADRDTINAIAGVPDKHCEIIPGSGVDLDLFRPGPIPDGPPVVMLAARMLRDKGVLDFVAAARILRSADRGVGRLARFVLVGAVDPGNPASLSRSEILSIKTEGAVELWGSNRDMWEVLPKASVIVLPSYREGLPKVLVEAAACGRAVVTTDVPGCRDAILSGVTGLLVPPRRPDELASAIEGLLRDPARCAALGSAGRRLAERSFGIEGVVVRHMDIYSALIQGGCK
jgi:glycosyltransferase involved in cell wall biosynthesis